MDPAQWRKALIMASGPLEELHNAGKLITLEDEEEAFTDFYFTLLEEAGLPADREAANIISRDRTYVYEGKYILADGIHQVLDTLKQQGYRLGILSDTWPSIVPMLSTLTWNSTSMPAPTVMYCAPSSLTHGCTRMLWTSWDFREKRRYSLMTWRRTWTAQMYWASMASSLVSVQKNPEIPGILPLPISGRFRIS